MCMCVHVCVCMCERLSARVCVCACVHADRSFSSPLVGLLEKENCLGLQLSPRKLSFVVNQTAATLVRK